MAYQMPVLYILILSITIQAAAAVMALRLIAVTGRKIEWVLISSVLMLMAVRRVIPLYRLISGDLSVPPDPLNESIGLVLSMVMAFVLGRITPLFIERLHIEKALRESEQRLAVAQRIAHIGHWELDLINSALFWSDEIYRIFEIDPGRFGASYEGFLNAIHPDDRLAVDAAYRNSVKNRVPYAIDHRLLFADGRIKFVHEQCETFYDQAGAPLRSLGTVQDITERKRAEEEVRIAGAYNRSLIEVSLDALVTIGPGGKITDVNAATEEATGRSRSELVGTDFSDYFTEPKEARSGYQKVFKEGFVRDYPLELQHRDGRVISVLYNASVYRDESGQIAGVFAAARDITGRKKAEEALRRLSQRNEMILNSAGEGIYGTDIEGNIMFINAAAQEMFGFRSEELIGKNSHKIFHHTKADGKPYPIEECPLHRSLNEGESYRGQDEVFWTRDGRMFPVEHVNTPLIENGKVVGAVVVFRDIAVRKKAEEEIRMLTEELEQRVTERTAELKNNSRELEGSQRALMNIVEDLNEKTVELEQANAKLHELDRLKSMFVASMSHELRTPLNSVIGFSSIMLNEWLGPVNDEQKKNLATILRAGKHLLNLVNDVIDVSKIEAGKIDVSPEAFDLHDLIAEAVELITKEAAEKGLAMIVENMHLQMRADRRRLLQCVLNLLSNAVKFTLKGTVKTSARLAVDTRLASRGPGTALQPGDFVEIRIEDTGIGIRPEDSSRMFQAFSRLAPPPGITVGGTGLGLYLTKKLVAEILEGDILYESRYGEGSSFSIIVPVSIQT